MALEVRKVVTLRQRELVTGRDPNGTPGVPKMSVSWSDKWLQGSSYFIKALLSCTL